jgi:hypothetical protein
MKDGPPLVLDAIALFQLAADPAFFSTLPAGFSDWEQSCRDAYMAVVNQTVRAPASACYRCGSVSHTMSPVLSELGRRLASFQASGGNLEPLANLVAAKRGYRPRPLVLYYRSEDGKILSLSL